MSAIPKELLTQTNTDYSIKGVSQQPPSLKPIPEAQQTIQTCSESVQTAAPKPIEKRKVSDLPLRDSLTQFVKGISSYYRLGDLHDFLNYKTERRSTITAGLWAPKQVGNTEEIEGLVEAIREEVQDCKHPFKDLNFLLEELKLLDPDRLRQIIEETKFDLERLVKELADANKDNPILHRFLYKTKFERLAKGIPFPFSLISLNNYLNKKKKEIQKVAQDTTAPKQVGNSEEIEDLVEAIREEMRDCRYDFRDLDFLLEGLELIDSNRLDQIIDEIKFDTKAVNDFTLALKLDAFLTRN